MAATTPTDLARPRGDHAHPWPTDSRWTEISGCELCGMRMLHVFVSSPSWVIRRVEHIRFRDDRTVRREVSVDYATPEHAVLLRGASSRTGVRVVPLALMRRKTLVNFDLRDDEGRPMPLIGLRESQALTLASLRAWARQTLDGDVLCDEVEQFLDMFVRGGQGKLSEARERWERADGQLGLLKEDRLFQPLLERFGDTFLLYALDLREPRERHIVKFGYDERLRLRFSRPGYDPAKYLYDPGEPLPRWSREHVLATLGFRPTLIRFPVPAAELSTSFHAAIEAPPETSIVSGRILAGRPNPDPDRPYEDHEGRSGYPTALQRPSFDRIRGNFPFVDLHVTDVPSGSLSRAQIELQANSSGFLSAAALSCVVATVALAVVASFRSARNDDASAALIGLSGALIAVLVRPDPHRMVTRLLAGVRRMAGATALLAFAGAIALTIGDLSAWPVIVVAALSAIATVLVVAAWWRATRHGRTDEESPWEQRWTAPIGQVPEGVRFESELEDHPEPFGRATDTLGFGRPAVRVATSEGWRREYVWTLAFSQEVQERLERGLAEASARQRS
jgi:hypothetical protein